MPKLYLNWEMVGEKLFLCLRWLPQGSAAILSDHMSGSAVSRNSGACGTAMHCDLRERFRSERHLLNSTQIWGEDYCQKLCDLFVTLRTRKSRQEYRLKRQVIQKWNISKLLGIAEIRNASVVQSRAWFFWDTRMSVVEEHGISWICWDNLCAPSPITKHGKW